MAKGFDFEMGTVCDYSLTTPNWLAGFTPQGDSSGGLPGGYGQLPRDVWTLVAVTWDGQSANHYINGHFAGSYSIPGLLNNGFGDFTIGCIVMAALSTISLAASTRPRSTTGP